MPMLTITCIMMAASHNPGRKNLMTSDAITSAATSNFEKPEASVANTKMLPHTMAQTGGIRKSMHSPLIRPA